VVGDLLDRLQDSRDVDSRLDCVRMKILMRVKGDILYASYNGVDGGSLEAIAQNTLRPYHTKSVASTRSLTVLPPVKGL
jgi:hypothetical protein